MNEFEEITAVELPKQLAHENALMDLLFTSFQALNHIRSCYDDADNSSWHLVDIRVHRHPISWLFRD